MKDFCLPDGKILPTSAAGPHIPSTGKIKAFKLFNIAGAHWLGDEKNQQLQRIYGTSFFSKKDLDDYLKQLEEAKKRDHRVLGKQLDLFSIQELAGPGLIFWHAKGGIIRKEMEDWMRGAHTSSAAMRWCIRRMWRGGNYSSLRDTKATTRRTCSTPWSSTTPNIA